MVSRDRVGSLRESQSTIVCKYKHPKMMAMAMLWKLIVIALVLITDSNPSLTGSLVISSPAPFSPLWNYFLTCTPLCSFS